MKFPRHIPFVGHLGFGLPKFQGGEARVAVPYSPALRPALPSPMRAPSIRN